MRKPEHLGDAAGRRPLLEDDAACGVDGLALTALDSLGVSLVVVDSSLHVVRANELFRKTFHISLKNGRARSLDAIWRSQPLREKLRALVGQGKRFTDVDCELRKSAVESRTLTISGRAVGRGGERTSRFLLSIQDITRHRKAIEQAAWQKSEGRQREFVANVSHELMTPITAIKGYSEALISGALDAPNKRLKFTQIIEKHADRLAQLVEDLLHLSTAEAGLKKSVDSILLAERLQRAATDLEPMARKRGISIRVKSAPGLKVAMNKSELNQILHNLLQNAIKYNRAKGRISIAASVVGKRALVMVQDTGIGVPKEDLIKIFDRFHRAPNARAATERGTGLGLSIAKSILVARGCRIWAESALGKGTTFFFTLPKA